MAINGVSNQNAIDNIALNQVDRLQQKEQAPVETTRGGETQEYKAREDTVDVTPRNETQELSAGEQIKDQVRAIEVQKEIEAGITGGSAEAIIAQGTNISAANVANLL